LSLPQLVPNDPYTREEAAGRFAVVRKPVPAEPNVTAYYFPTYEQYPVAGLRQTGCLASVVVSCIRLL
jgi:hypothetical protein